MKLSKDVLHRVKQIEIQTRRLLSGTQVGNYSSAQKGTGLEFDQLRDYQMGDDVRFIDWNASARSTKILVKQYIEERNRTVILLVDRSASTFFGSSDLLKSDVIAQIASVLALVADYGKDRVGAFLFAEDVEHVIPPKRGKKHIHHIMERIFTHQCSGKTSLSSALQKLISMQKQDAIVFILSDFLDTGYEKFLKIVARQHEVIGIRCLDKKERSMPHCGNLNVEDPETGQIGLINTNNNSLNMFLEKQDQDLIKKFKRHGVDLLDINVDSQFVGDIIRFFRQRMMY